MTESEDTLKQLSGLTDTEWEQVVSLYKTVKASGCGHDLRDFLCLLVPPPQIKGEPRLMTFLDGDFDTDAPCSHHCYPTCHPQQVGPERVYGCRHPDHPGANQGFVPIVDCEGDPDRCEIVKAR